MNSKAYIVKGEGMKRTVCGIMLTVLLTGMLTLAFNIQPVKAEPITIIVPDDYPKIQEAINAANEGDTIFVKNGTYYENIVVNKTVTLTGENKAATIIDGNWTGKVVTLTADNVKISGFTIEKSGMSGTDSAIVIGGSNTIISDNIILSCYFGVRLDYNSNNTIAENIITNSREWGFGVYLWHSSSNRINKNEITKMSRGWGIYITYGSNNNNVTYNNLRDNWSNLYLDISTGNRIVGNNLSRLSPGGWKTLAVLEWGSNVFYHNNIEGPLDIYESANVWDNGYPSGGNYWSDYIGVDFYSGPYQNETGSDGIGDTPYFVDVNNQDKYPLMNPWIPFMHETICIRADGSVDPSGAPIWRKGDLYTLTGNITSDADGIVIERDNMTLDGAGYMLQGIGGGPPGYIGIDLSGRKNITITNMEIKRFHYGIFRFGLQNRIIGNIIGNNWWGLYIFESLSNIVSGNNMTENSYNVMIDYKSSYNIIIGNNISGGGWGIGLHKSSTYNSISRNNITVNYGYGIGFDYSSNHNNVSENTIAYNGYGIWLEDSSNNHIYHNNLLTNTNQFYISNSSNVWDDGYPSGGNYWSDYVGFDIKNGPNQDLPGSDCMGDSPYIINELNVDHYPLMNPYGASPPQTYNLTITTTVGGTTDPALGTYSYTANSTVEVTAIPEANYLFEYWKLDGVNVGSANPYTVLMDKAHTLKAVFSLIPPPFSVSISPLSASILIGQSVTFTSTVSGGITPYSYQWFLNGAPVSGATSSSWTFMPTTSGIYYIYLKVTDAKANTAQSETACIAVATVPVGGYAYSINKYTLLTPIATHIALIAILTTIFITIKRKTKRKH